MNGVVIAGAGVVDAAGVLGTAGAAARWTELRGAAPGEARAWRTLFPTRPPDLRRADGLTRALLFAAEAAGAGRIDPALRPETATVLGTGAGCLEADLRFAAGLPHAVEPGLFPATLPNAALGQVAIRFGLRGPTLVLSTPAGGDAFAEGARLLAAGEAAAVLVACGDWLAPDVARQTGRAVYRALACLVLRRDGAAAPMFPAGWWPRRPDVAREVAARLAGA